MFFITKHSVKKTHRNYGLRVKQAEMINKCHCVMIARVELIPHVPRGYKFNWVLGSTEKSEQIPFKLPYSIEMMTPLKESSIVMIAMSANSSKDVKLVKRLKLNITSHISLGAENG